MVYLQKCFHYNLNDYLNYKKLFYSVKQCHSLYLVHCALCNALKYKHRISVATPCYKYMGGKK